MPDLAFELRQLQVADQHIANAERDVAEMEALARQREIGADDVQVSEQALAAVRRGLEVFREHRALIAQVIDDLRAGRLPRTPDRG